MNQNPFKSGYSDVNGLKMYYEIHGSGYPLVLIHGGGSTIHSSFGNIIPLLALKHQVIAMELQAHGRTNDRDTDLSFTQDADDVATLLHNLNISKADFLGFSNGGQTAIELALRHTEIINKLIIASSFFKRSAAAPQFWDGFEHVSFNDMPPILHESFLLVNNNPAALLNMFNKDVRRMKFFKGWSEEEIRSIKAPALVINGNQDVGSVEHAVEMHTLIPDCQLAILPGSHGAYLGTLDSLENRNWEHTYAAEIIEEFLCLA
jgi:pimeloyl-ACP methyl ester carboxylesterase